MQAIADAAQAESQKATTKPRVFYDVGYIDTTGQIYGPGEGSFLAEMVGLLGVDVITGDKLTYEIPLETLIERDPQTIILGVNAYYTPTPDDDREAARLEGAQCRQERRRPVGDRYRDHPPGTSPRDRHAQPGARDVPRPPAPAGELRDR